mgnify:FL=1
MTIKTIVIACLTMPALVACTSTPRGYGPMEPGSSFGYSEQIIEQNRYRVSYSAENEAMAREYALRRAAEVTEQNGGDWFRVVNSFSSGRALPSRSGPRVSVGGSSGSGGFSAVGVGVGIGFPIGGGSQNADVTHNMEILIGRGPRPEGYDTYDAAAVRANLGGY